MEDALTVKRDQIVSIVKEEGPLLPIIISKKLEVDTTYSGAMLSEMVASKLLKLTSVKSGGSPFYYLDGQEEKLQELIQHLNSKDQDTANLLKEKKILKDRDLSPLQRVSLREIKDYAKQVNVKIDGQNNLFWRWYLLEEGEVKGLITKYLESNIEDRDSSSLPQQENPLEKEPLKKAFAEKGNSPKTHLSRQVQREEEKPVEVPVSEEQREEVKVEEQTNLQGEREVVKERAYDPLGGFFMENEVEIMQQEIIKKDKDINYLVGLETKIGKGLFFLKYRDKKKINEADLSLALHEAGKVPLIFLTTGKLTKNAKEKLNKEFRGIMFKRL